MPSHHHHNSAPHYLSSLPANGVVHAQQQQQYMEYYYGVANNAELHPLVISNNSHPSVITTTTLHTRGITDEIASVFSSVRSVSTADLEADLNESDLYLKGSALKRALFPERIYVLMTSLIFELPVLFMMSRKSDHLCHVLGRTKYQLLLAFLPLTCAISGNCGIQCSMLTTRAVSHSHVTAHTFMKQWLWVELLSSLYVGFAMGSVIGIMAFFSSNCDVKFGVTIGIAQVISIWTAGLTGTLAPFCVSFVFRNTMGKWGASAGQFILETVIQDIVGSFVMIVISYRLLILLGSGELPPTDTCM
jgi:Mg/Co/Ni transporter MgtE